MHVIEVMDMPAPLSTKPGASPANGRPVSTRARMLRLFWFCLGLGLLALIALVWLWGLTWWTVLLAALLFACPAVMSWILLGGGDR